MNHPSKHGPVSLSIASVERDTGLSKDTLRVWERRYGFPAPVRDSFGERLYSIEQVDKLRILRRLMDAGHRPGKIIGLAIDELQALAAHDPPEPRSFADAGAERDELGHCIELIKSHQVEEVRRLLSQAVLRMGLERFVVEVVAPLNRMVGEAWARGYFEIFEEHLYTESMQIILRSAISNIPKPDRRPRVLLTTFPGEAHGLGLLMAEVLLALDGCRCISLGTQTPIRDIVLAADGQKADVVALSFSACLNPNQVVAGLAELRSKLADGSQIWAGGQCPILQRRPPKDVMVLPELRQIHPSLAAWRATHPDPAA